MLRYTVLCLIALYVTLEEPKQASSQLKSRHKRYVVFPEGSTLSIAFCNTWKTLTGDKDIYTMGMNWAISYDLPNETLRDPNTKRPYLRRRHRREVYRRLEVAMQSAGLDGHSCVLRAMCEVARYVKPRKSLLQELLRLIFMLPEENLGTTPEAEELKMYKTAQLRGSLQEECVRLYSSCPLSITELILGNQED